MGSSYVLVCRRNASGAVTVYPGAIEALRGLARLTADGWTITCIKRNERIITEVVLRLDAERSARQPRAILDPYHVPVDTRRRRATNHV